jgi:hypothetical protein
MKRTFVIGLFGLSGAVLLGCPVFSGNNSPSVAPQCTGNYCTGIYCSTSNECPSGQSCEDNYCVQQTGDGATDGSTDATDCVPACTAGQQCTVLDDGGLGCVTSKPSDAGGDTLPPFTGCTSNAQCASADGGAGALCLDGKCVPPANQCFDGTQCAPNEDCVQGACVPTCSSTVACPTGYSCDLTNGVCTGNPTPCGGADGGAACTGGTTCVEQHCVPTCMTGDKCGTGLVCVDNGCIPDQAPIFTCNVDGAEGDGGPGNCDVGSICLDHSCFISCVPATADGGTTACSKTMFPECKPVIEGSTTYYACGTATNLGNQCNPTQGMNCSGADQVCIDGYCQ